MDSGWLDAEERRLLEFARNARLGSGGFGWLDRTGRPEPGRPLELWINCRMTYVFALAHLMGEPDAAAYVDHGLAALAGPFRDGRHGGWYSRVGDGPIDTDPATKSAYDHAFVLLAAASAVVADRPGAQPLLDHAMEVVDSRFWDEATGTVVDTYDATWSELEDYRGANASMHMVEAFLAVADTTGDPLWRQRAARIVARLVHTQARAHHWRMPEHYDATWTPRLDFNRDQPDHPFRPYGATVGHGLEWSRLVLNLHAAAGPDLDPGVDLVADARALFDASVQDGWSVDGAPGFVYTVDWDGRPVVRHRMHWVVAEAILAAFAQARYAGDEEARAAYLSWADRWWDFARTCHVDLVDGSWVHELDEANRPTYAVWDGKPDVYHAFQACLLPRLPLHPSPAVALAQGLGA